MIRWTAELWNDLSIRKCDVERETACYVWVGGFKQLKISVTRIFFNSFDAAKEYLLGVLKNRLEANAKRHAELITTIDKVKEIQEGDVHLYGI